MSNAARRPTQPARRAGAHVHAARDRHALSERVRALLPLVAGAPDASRSKDARAAGAAEGVDVRTFGATVPEGTTRLAIRDTHPTRGRRGPSSFFVSACCHLAIIAALTIWFSHEPQDLLRGGDEAISVELVIGSQDSQASEPSPSIAPPVPVASVKPEEAQPVPAATIAAEAQPVETPPAQAQPAEAKPTEVAQPPVAATPPQAKPSETPAAEPVAVAAAPKAKTDAAPPVAPLRPDAELPAGTIPPVTVAETPAAAAPPPPSPIAEPPAKPAPPRVRPEPTRDMAAEAAARKAREQAREQAREAAAERKRAEAAREDRAAKAEKAARDEKARRERTKQNAERASPKAAHTPGEGNAEQRSAASTRGGTGGAGPVAGTAAIASYRGSVLAHLARFKQYPEGARERGIVGVPAVSFTLSRSGAVLSVSLLRPSGQAMLDQATVAMVRRASPFPPIPAGGPATMNFNAAINYNLR